MVLLLDFVSVFVFYCKETDRICVAADHLGGKTDCFSHVLSLILFQNGFPQIVFSS